jgi:hypothetical protein
MSQGLVEIQKEYTTFLTNSITPLIYEGLSSLYEYSQKKATEIEGKAKYDSSIDNPGVLAIFQVKLSHIPDWNKEKISTETQRIKESSGCSEWFDDLIRAIIKSNITLLTGGRYFPMKMQEHYKRIDTQTLIHKSYIECARYFYLNPYLFYQKYPNIEIRRNQMVIFEKIQNSIIETIRQLLPMKIILQEYLSGVDIPESSVEVRNTVPQPNYMAVEALVKRDLDVEKDKFDAVGGISHNVISRGGISHGGMNENFGMEDDVNKISMSDEKEDLPIIKSLISELGDDEEDEDDEEEEEEDDENDENVEENQDGGGDKSLIIEHYSNSPPNTESRKNKSSAHSEHSIKSSKSKSSIENKNPLDFITTSESSQEDNKTDVLDGIGTFEPGVAPVLKTETEKSAYFGKFFQ